MATRAEDQPAGGIPEAGEHLRPARGKRRRRRRRWGSAPRGLGAGAPNPAGSSLPLHTPVLARLQGGERASLPLHLSHDWLVGFPTRDTRPPRAGQLRLHHHSLKMKIVLMVAEKPSLAQSIAKILSRGNMSSRKGLNGACSVHEFTGPFIGQTVHFKMTSVCGHVMTLDFIGKYNNWDKVDPAELFSKAPTEKKEANPKLNMVKFLQTTYRAKFSSITDTDICNAMNQLGEPNHNEALSVDARQELDLRIGCAFTRRPRWGFVESVSKKEKVKQRPLALNTVEMLRVASAAL
ncbi:DNA topoisomerase 3-beta-1, partial [Ophiophagus hannah]